MALSAAALLASAPAAFASGGGGRGGGGVVVPVPASSSCARITSFSDTTAYNWALLSRVDTSYAMASACPGAVTADVTYTNQLTGAVDFERSAPWPAGTTSVISTFVHAPAPFSTPYTVTLSLYDSSFNVLASRSASITTKKPQQGTT